MLMLLPGMVPVRLWTMGCHLHAFFADEIGKIAQLMWSSLNVITISAKLVL
jgi:hypothetical protein